MIRYAIVGWICLTAVPLSAAEHADRMYDLSCVHMGARFEGSQEARRLLERQGFVVTEKQFLQIFEAYLSLYHGGPPMPKFITVDSAWHTYHVLLEESVQRLEEEQAVSLAAFSRELYGHARAKIGTASDVYADLALFAAVAWALQDTTAVAELDERDRPKVEEVLAVLRAGGSPQPVLFFGLPVMPEQYAAAGFYIRSPGLKGYFAARKWYATNVFRVDSQEETKRAVHLALLVDSNADLKRRYTQLSAPYAALLAPAEDASVVEYASLAQRVMGKTPTAEQIRQKLDTLREEAAKLPAPGINDQYLPPNEYAHFGEATKGFRLLPPRHVPSAVLFQRTVDPSVKNRGFPSGLDFFAIGPMASDAGRRALRYSANDATCEAILAAETVKLPDSLHGQALSLLQRLQEPLPEQVPRPLRTLAWQDKQLFTQLGAWAQQRHTWALHTKVTIHYGGFTDEPPGYVSPYPEFFRGLARLSRDTSRVFRKVKNREAMGPVAGHTLSDLIAAARRVDAAFKKRTGLSMIDQSKSERLMAFWSDSGLLDERVVLEDPEDLDNLTPTDYTPLERIARRWIESESLSQRDRKLIALLSESEGVAAEYLVEFADLCDRLAAIAEKQLDDRPLSKEDAGLIKDYGITLARFHFYGGNSYLTPRDDFPQVVPIFSSPFGTRNELLYAGLPRPEAVYVIIQVGDRPVLHRGAVLSYREFRRPINEPLDDDSWTQEVWEGRVPPPPKFTSSFRRTITEEEVVQMLRHGKLYYNAAYMTSDVITDAMLDALMKGNSEDTDRLREQLRYRITETHIPRLLTYLETRKPDRRLGHEIGEIVLRIAELDWRPHRKRVLGLLHHEVIQVADAAAYILAQRPDELDTAVLATHLEKGKLRTRRLIGYLLGHVKPPDERTFQLVLELMENEHPGLRYQAMLAAVRWQAGGMTLDALPVELRLRLLTAIGDENQSVAGTAVRAVVALGMKEAAPRILKRLKDEGKPQEFEDGVLAQPVQRDIRSAFEETDYGGIVALNVLDRPSFGTSSFVDELLAGLKAFRYQPAAEHLHTMLRQEAGFSQMGSGKDWGPEALDVLIYLKPERKTELLTTVMRDDDHPGWTRSRAVERLAETKNLGHVADLLPLLKQDVGLGYYWPNYRGFSASPKSLGESVALAIAQLLISADSDNPAHNKIRQRAVKELTLMLRTPIGPSALAALASIEPEQFLARAIGVAMDREFPAATRSGALHLLGQVSYFDEPIVASGLYVDIRHLKRLLPLIEDDTKAGFQTIGEEAAGLVAHLARVLAQTPEHAQEIAQIRHHLASLLSTRHAAVAFEALQGIDPEQAARNLTAVVNDRKLAAKSRARALDLTKRFPQDVAFVQSLAPLLADHTVSEEDQRICDLVARIIAEQLEVELPFPRSSQLEDRNAFVERVREALEGHSE